MDQKEKTDIRSLNLKELTVFMEQLGEKAFRAKQIYQWLHQKLVADFDEMSNLSKPLREKLKEQFVKREQSSGQHKTGGSTDLQNRRNEEIPVSVR